MLYAKIMKLELTTVTPNITTKRSDAMAITITAIPHCGSNASSSGSTIVGSSRFGNTAKLSFFKYS